MHTDIRSHFDSRHFADLPVLLGSPTQIPCSTQVPCVSLRTPGHSGQAFKASDENNSLYWRNAGHCGWKCLPLTSLRRLHTNIKYGLLYQA